MKKTFIGFLAAVAIALVSWNCSGGSTPSDVAKKAIEYVQDKNYDGYVDLIHFEAKEGQNVEEQKEQLTTLMTEKLSKTLDMKGGIASYEILGEEIAEDGNSAVVKANIVYGDGDTKEEKFKMTKTADGDWKFDLNK